MAHTVVFYIAKRAARELYAVEYENFRESARAGVFASDSPGKRLSRKLVVT